MYVNLQATATRLLHGTTAFVIAKKAHSCERDQVAYQ
jgi:hypothetical protein